MEDRGENRGIYINKLMKLREVLEIVFIKFLILVILLLKSIVN